MIQPHSKLPWKEKLIKNKYAIVDSNDIIVTKDVENLSNAM